MIEELNIFFHEFMDHMINYGMWKYLYHPTERQVWHSDNMKCLNKLQMVYDVEMYAGAYRMAFVFDNFDWVLKIPFIDEFNDEPDVWNIQCEVECENYLRAKQEGLDEYFAETFELAPYEYDDWKIPLYAMKKVAVNERRIDEYLYALYDGDSEDEDDIEDWVAENYDAEFVVSLALETEYGQSEFSRLNRFLGKWMIDDLHPLNVGWDEKDHLVIIDYSGYSRYSR